MNKKYLIIGLIVLVLIALGVLLFVWYKHKTYPVSKPTVANPITFRTDNGGPMPGPGKYWHHGDALLPNPDLSPGDIRPLANGFKNLTEEVCNESAQDFRNTSDKLKNQVYELYGEKRNALDCVKQPRQTKSGKTILEGCECDHLVSLELGGADDIKNLWPQPYNPPSGLGAHAKDKVENWLHEQVCKAHTMALEEAQKKIATDWYQVYLDAHLDK